MVEGGGFLLLSVVMMKSGCARQPNDRQTLRREAYLEHSS